MNDSPMTAEDLTLYAMRLLEPDEAARVEDLLQRSPEARTELAEVRGDLALFALTTEQHAPSPLLRQRLLKEIAREPRATAMAEPAQLPDARQQAAIPAPAEIAMHVQPPASQETEGTPQQRPETLASPALPDHVFAQDLFLSSAGNSGQASARAADAPAPVPAIFRSTAPEPEPRRSLLSFFLPWTGWAVATALGIAAFNLYRQADTLHERLAVQVAATERARASSARAQEVLDTLRSSEAKRFILTKTDAQPVAQARVTYLASTGSLVFQGSHLDPLPSNKTYELWLIPAEAGGKPIAAGLFRPDERGEANVILPELPKGIVAGKFGITMEDDGGAATPTAPILLAGQ